MSQVHVRAWNEVDAKGRPIFLVDREMTGEQAEALPSYVCTNYSIRRIVLREDIDKALAEGR